MSVSVSELFTSTFPVLVLAHGLALLSPGPDFFLIAGHAARRRLSGTIWMCLGIAFGHALYIVLAIAGWSGIREYPALYRAVELAGAVYLMWMSVMLWRSGATPRRLDAEAAKPLGSGAQLVVGLGAALLNPKNAVFYLTLMTGILGATATVVQQSVAGVWMVMAVLAWDVGIAACIGHRTVQRRLEAYIPRIERLASLILAVTAVAILWPR